MTKLKIAVMKLFCVVTIVIGAVDIAIGFVRCSGIAVAAGVVGIACAVAAWRLTVQKK